MASGAGRDAGVPRRVCGRWLVTSLAIATMHVTAGAQAPVAPVTPVAPVAPVAPAATVTAPVTAAATPLATAAAGVPDGRILERAPCAQSGSSHAEYVERAKRQWQDDAAAAARAGAQARPVEELAASLLTPEEYAARKAYAGLRCERLVYASDGLRVVAFLWRPERPAGERLPLIIFNRGGYGEDFKLRPNTWFGFYNFVSAGYAVLGTQYRGNDGETGRDEFGGADLDDVLNLLPLSTELGLTDPARVYLLGFSRGAMMTLLALQRGVSVRAAAVMGAPTDLTKATSPAALERYAQLIPGFARDPQQALRARSALLHVADLHVPLLLLQGGADALVHPADSTALADALLRARKPVELVVYDGDTHGIALNARDRDRRILEWFARH